MINQFEANDPRWLNNKTVLVGCMLLLTAAAAAV
jgi:hypothetical protein